MRRIGLTRRAVVGCAVMIGGGFASGIAWGSVVTDNPSGWTQTFNDDFDGTDLDPTKWVYRLTGVRNSAINTPNAVSVGGGALTITTYTEAGTNYTGMIGTRDLGAQKDLFAQTYGYFEARMKFNTTPGQWSAFWLTSPVYDGNVGNPALYGTEIDIVEHRAVNKDNAMDLRKRYVSAVHWDGYDDEHMQSARTHPEQAMLGNGSWHTYGLRWSPSGYDFYFDDVLLWTTTQAISARPEYMILSSEVRNNNWAGLVPVEGYGSLATSTTNVQVDYVRAYAAVPEPAGIASLALAGLAMRRYRRHDA